MLAGFLHCCALQKDTFCNSPCLALLLAVEMYSTSNLGNSEASLNATLLGAETVVFSHQKAKCNIGYRYNYRRGG